ncbi:four helix bundle protein [Mucilaginibacter terrigena]|uniref:Four helix bundle protein n=1 Tax=Mucilaginibacter terrigena TaxID=2492395 RepID=A0A4Q5LJX7_9SPHI|nr:four helix bundle protein [Mucilaginibacter terrigena]RYU89931.1 four helix bundle protein [Mucilaginibacter terrigena]
MGNRIEDLEIYTLADSFSNKIWFLVLKWDYFAKDTVGKQIARSADSISANIAEGFGRFHYKENKNFCYFSRGSSIETKGWLNKCLVRNLISEEKHLELIKELETIHHKLNIYIKYIGKKIIENPTMTQ